MTREEAIDRLKEARAGHKEFLSIETLNMAIKALQEQADTIPREAVKDVSYDRGDNWWVKNMREQIKAQADGEYISKQVVLNTIDQWYEDKADIEDLIVKITYIQGVAIPNKVGHWEYNQYDGNPNIGNWHCSECRNIVSDMPTCMGKPLYEFCPNCGCPMEIER